MSRFLSLTAFAAEVGWHHSDIEKLVAENKIKAYQLLNSEPYIPKTELARVKRMTYQVSTVNAKEERLIQDEADRVSRANSRSKIAAEREALESKIENRRSALALKRANTQVDGGDS